MDNSKVLKPIIGPQETAESKKKEKNKKKKALIVSVLAFLIATGTIWASIAVVKANMPKLEIRFDDWFVDSFDFKSMQAFIDEHRLSKGDIDKELPGYVGKKAKDQNVKNADMITNPKMTNKIPEDKNNKLPKGIYIEMTAETDYIFAYQADLSLEENKDNTKGLVSIANEPKKPRYYISSDKTKLYVLVYERESDSDESLPGDLQTFNDFYITNTQEAFNKLNMYIGDQTRRYTEEEFTSNKNHYEPGLDIFYKALIGFEKQYISKDRNAISFPIEDGQTVIKIKLDNSRSNFHFEENNPNVKYNEEEGAITISGLNYFRISNLNLTNLQSELQEYIQKFDPNNGIDRRYTLEEFRNQMGNEELREMILKSVGILPKKINSLDNDTTDPDNPEVPEEPKPPLIDTSKLRNMYISNNNLVIEFMCEENQKYGVLEEMGYDTEKYQFDEVNDRLTVKGLKYFTEYEIANTQSSWENLNAQIVKISNQYTVEEFSTFVESESTQQQCKQLIAKGLTANNKTFNPDLITNLSVEQIPDSENKIKLTIKFDNDFKKYKTSDDEQFQVDSITSTMEIQLTCYKTVQMNNLKVDIQEIIDKAPPGQQYTVQEFEQEINKTSSNNQLTVLQNKIKGLVEANIDGSKDFNKFKYNKTTNELKFQFTIPAYEKIIEDGIDVTYKLVRKNNDDTAVYEATITGLEYWFDFEITDENLIKTRNNVAKYIENNYVVITQDPDEGNYDEFAKDIFNEFGKTPLVNGQSLSDYMIYDDQNYIRNDTTFTINLSSKINEANRCRGCKVNSIPKSKITFDDTNKTLTFAEFESSSPSTFFVLNEKTKENYGLSDSGIKQKSLKLPPNYNVNAKKELVDIGDGTKKQSHGFHDLKEVKKITMSDTITSIKGYFIYNCPTINTVKLSRNLSYVQGPYFIYKNPKLENLDWNGIDKLTVIENGNCLRSLGLKHYIVPRSFQILWTYWFGNEPSSSYQNTQADYFISWAYKYPTSLGIYQKNAKAFIILAPKNKTLITGYSSSNTFGELVKSSPNIKFYVNCENHKQRLLTVQSFGLKDKNFPEDQIIVRENLEQDLIDDGIIPEDW